MNKTTVALALLFCVSAVFAAPGGGGKGEGKEKPKKEAKASKGERAKADKGKGNKGKGVGKARAKKAKLKGIERKIARLKVIADRLEKKGKTEQAKRIRDKVAKAEAKLAKKKPQVEKEAAAEALEEME